MRKYLLSTSALAGAALLSTTAIADVTISGYSEFGYKVNKNNQLIPDDKEFEMLQSMISLRRSGLGYRQISQEIKNKYGKRIYFPQVYKILNRPYNRHF